MGKRVILHVEDSEADAFLFAQELEIESPELSLQRVNNGTKALEYLSGTGAFADRSRYPVPELLLLDINLPGLNGFNVLAWARSQPALHDLRIWMVSSSDLQEDVERARQLGADRYLVKDPTFHQVVDAVQSSLNAQN